MVLHLSTSGAICAPQQRMVVPLPPRVHTRSAVREQVCALHAARREEPCTASGRQSWAFPALQEALLLFRPVALAAVTTTTAVQMQLPLLFEPQPAQAAQAAIAGVADQDAGIGSIPQEEIDELREMMSEEVAMPSQLLDFLKLFEKDTPKNAKQLEQARLTVGFTRTLDGRVLLIGNDGERFAIKPDAQSAGVLLLRDNLGYCYYLPSDPSNSLQQLDLSDDLIVAQLFANHLWEDLLEPLEVASDGPFKGPGGEGPAVKQLQLTEPEWRRVFSLVAGGELQPEQPLEAMSGEEEDSSD